MSIYSGFSGQPRPSSCPRPAYLVLPSRGERVVPRAPPWQDVLNKETSWQNWNQWIPHVFPSSIHLVKYTKYIDDVIYYIIHNFGYMGKFLTQLLLYSPTYVLFRFEDFPINMIVPCTFWIPRIVLPLKQFWMRRGTTEWDLFSPRSIRLSRIYMTMSTTLYRNMRLDYQESRNVINNILGTKGQLDMRVCHYSKLCKITSILDGSTTRYWGSYYI